MARQNAKSRAPLLLNDSLYEVAGIGEKRSTAFAAHGLNTVQDLLEYLPRAYINRSRITPMADLQEGFFASVVGRVERVQLIPRKRLLLDMRDPTGMMTVVFFGGLKFMSDKFKSGMRINAWGRVSCFGSMMQMAHPEYRILEEGAAPEKGIFPIYSSTEDLKEVSIDGKIMQAAVRDALDRTREEYPEALPLFIRRKRTFMSLKNVLRELHFPTDDSAEHLNGVKARLKYEEAFALCLKMAALAKDADLDGIRFKPSLTLLSHVYRNAGFQPTNAQAKVISEIETELFKGRRLYRLLQGDVGSGKTFVCAVALAHVLENGYQGVLMAPTEILARQHFKELSRLFKDCGKRIALFVGALTAGEKRALYESLALGEIDLAVGTHALLADDVRFGRLGLAIIDEQHRFGVRQRLALKRKGNTPGILVVSATPIPRTLSLTIYGDLQVSVINELPPGRIPVRTFRVTEAKRIDMYGFIEEKLKTGGRAFFILPLVEESDKLQEIKSLLSMSAHLQQDIFKSWCVGILHGKMEVREKDQILERFREGKIHVLVATTVVEVGIDIPDADIMVVEHPERFGLAQLHQLRGRIGRGRRESFCFLLPGTAGEAATERLRRFSETSDGFAIAELDFELRGTGDLAGLRQSGIPDFKYLNLVNDAEIIAMAREDARQIIANGTALEGDDLKLVNALLKRYEGLREEVLATA